MGAIQDTKIADEPARLRTSVKSKNPHQQPVNAG
jgi:hypothetical protein